jgi:hypothetical protein
MKKIINVHLFITFQYSLKDVLIFVYVENRYYNISHIQRIRKVPIKRCLNFRVC